MRNKECFNFFHSQLCSGFGAPNFCPDCGGSWRHSDRRFTEDVWEGSPLDILDEVHNDSFRHD